MMILAYLLKVSACAAACFTLYFFFFRKLTFFRFNRFYLIGSLLMSFVIPVTTVTIFSTFAKAPLTTLHVTDEPWEATITTEVLTTVESLPMTGVLWFVYLLGAGWMLLKFLHSMYRFFILWRRSRWEVNLRMNVVRQDSSPPFTFFHVACLPLSEPDSAIIEHERAHIRQWHWVDLVLVELACILLWFNPFVFFYRKSIKNVHEYLADSYTLKTGVTPMHYLSCLMDQIQANYEFKLSNPFYSGSIKSRIMMITKPSSSWRALLFYFLMFPAIAVLLFGFSNRPALTAISEPLIVHQEGKPDISPVDLSKLTGPVSGFGDRMHPMLKKVIFHSGIDFKMDEGTEVVAAADGTVADYSAGTAWGTLVKVKHNNTYLTTYAHLRNAVVKAGDKVTKGEIIGYVGSTGISTGPHLHYEVFQDGKAVDPLEFLPDFKK